MRNNDLNKIKKLENKLLISILERIKMEMKPTTESTVNDIRVRFYVSAFDGAKEHGYTEIQELIKLGAIQPFLTKYNLRMVDSKNVPNEKNVYYEIICTLENYKENLNENQNIEQKHLVKTMYNYS